VILTRPAKVSGELRDLFGLISKDVPQAREATVPMAPACDRASSVCA
jgi:hypothetical protein